MAKELNKNKTEQKNITQKLPGPYLAATHSPTLCSPPAQARPTSSPCLLPPLAPKQLGGERRRCLGHLLLPLVALDSVRNATQPLALLTPSGPLPLPWLSLSLSSCDPRTHLGAPLAVAMTAATPSPLRRAPELLHLVANPLTEPRDRKGPEQPPSSSSPSFGPGAVSVEFGHSGAPPSPLTLPTAPR